MIFGKTPLTGSTWDVYWIVVDKDLQGQGVGKKLIGRVEQYLRDKDGFATIRLETSSRKEYWGARKFYVKLGFKESGRIPDFYAVGDGLVTFYKKVEMRFNQIIDSEIGLS